MNDDQAGHSDRGDMPAMRSARMEGWQSLMSSVAVSGVKRDFATPQVLQEHHHAEGQLIYASRGVIVIGSPQGYWVVPPTRAVWLAPNVSHWARTSAGVRVRSVLVRADAEGQVPLHSCVLNVMPLMREVIIALADRKDGEQMSALDIALTQVLLLQLRALPILPLHLPALKDYRLLRIERHVLKSPDEKINLEKWAEMLSVTPRTLHRLFVKEVGMSYQQ
ncbi:hypothetical protein WM40_25560, partial [Robbsia andropogonis]